jgi:hypothetical protein
MTTRHVSFAGNSVTVSCSVPEQLHLVDYLFGDMEDDRTDEPLSQFRIYRSGDSEEISLAQDGERIYHGDDPPALARMLVEKALYSLVESDNSGLAIHAAAVGSDSAAALIPGQSGAGKSTLALWLTSRGFSYLTDELVHIPLNTRRMEPFTRPINLKRKGSDLVATELGIDDAHEQIMRTTQLSLVPHRLFNPDHKRVRPEISVILFPKLVDTAAHRVEPLSKGQAALKLVECLVNGRNIPSHGMDQVSRLVREVPAYVLHYSGFETLPGLLADVLPLPGSVEAAAPPRTRDAAS